jgi:hypothetical protein
MRRLWYLEILMITMITAIAAARAISAAANDAAGVTSAR